MWTPVFPSLGRIERAASPKQGVRTVTLGNDLLGDDRQAGLLDPGPVGRRIGVAHHIGTSPPSQPSSVPVHARWPVVARSHPPGRSQRPTRASSDGWSSSGMWMT